MFPDKPLGKNDPLFALDFAVASHFKYLVIIALLRIIALALYHLSYTLWHLENSGLVFKERRIVVFIVIQDDGAKHVGGIQIRLLYFLEMAIPKSLACVIYYSISYCCLFYLFSFDQRRIQYYLKIVLGRSGFSFAFLIHMLNRFNLGNRDSK